MRRSTLRNKQRIRTGIDLGTSSVKLVRGTGRDQFETVTHVGCRDWDAVTPDLSADQAARALRELLDELGLSRSDLGRVITSVGGGETSVREASLPYMSQEEFAQALPFEGRKYLSLDNLEDPILDGQIIESVLGENEGESSTLAMLAATSRTKRDFVLEVLGKAGIEPEIVNVEPIAHLNAMLHLDHLDSHNAEHAVALLDLGAKRANLMISFDGTGLLSREIWRGERPDGSADGESAYLRDIATRTLETLTFYRGRYRREVDAIYLTGGSALKEGRAEELGRIMNREVATAKPLRNIAEGAKGYDKLREAEPLFVTATGLARAEDEGYRINLYPEYNDKREAAKRRTWLTAAITAVAGLQILVIASLALNAHFLDTKAAQVSGDLPRLEEYIQRESEPRADLQTAQELLAIRRARVDWAPKLAAISRADVSGVDLVKLEGHHEQAAAPASLTIAGEARVDDRQLKRVGVFMTMLRDDEAFGPDFVSITLGNVKSDAAGGFDISCRTKEDDR